MCPTEDTALLFASLWMVLPAFGFPPTPNAHPTPLLPAYPPPMQFIPDIARFEKTITKPAVIAV